RAFFDRWGAATIVGARFVAGARAVMYLTAGAARVGVARFLFIDLLASLVYVPLLLLVGYYGGEQIDRLGAQVAPVQLVALALGARRRRARRQEQHDRRAEGEVSQLVAFFALERERQRRGLRPAGARHAL